LKASTVQLAGVFAAEAKGTCNTARATVAGAPRITASATASESPPVFAVFSGWR